MEKSNFKSILIAIDFHPSAQMIAQQGFKMAQLLGAEVTLMHAIKDFSSYKTTETSEDVGFAKCMETDHLLSDSLEGRSHQAQLYLQRINACYNGAAKKILVMEDEADHAILKAIGTVQADLVVMGSHSHNWEHTHLAGDVVRNVYTHSPVPVLIVPVRKEHLFQATEEIIPNVLIALDYNQSSEKIAKTGHALSVAINARLSLLHVIADSNSYSLMDYHPIKNLMGFDKNSASHLFDQGPVLAMDLFLNKAKEFLGDEKVLTFVREGDYVETILNFSRETNAALIVLGAMGQSWRKGVLIGDITNDIICRSLLPVLVVPAIKNW